MQLSALLHQSMQEGSRLLEVAMPQFLQRT